MKTRILRTLVVLAAAFALTGPAHAAPAQPYAAAPAQVAEMSFVLPASITPAMVPTGYVANGNYWYTKWVYVNGRAVLTGNLRFSWSHMWYIKNNFTTNSAAAAILCAAVPTTAGKAACGLVALYSGKTIYNKVVAAIKNKKCVTIRFGLPPYPYYVGMAWWESTCTR